MADTPCDNSYRIVSVSHGSTYFYDPLGGSIDETIDWLEHRPGSRLSPVLAMNGYSLRATVRWGLMSTPIVRGTSGTLTFTLKQLDGSANNTISITNMRAGAASFQLDSAPHEQRMEFVYDAGNSENFAPITVSVG